MVEKSYTSLRWRMTGIILGFSLIPLLSLGCYFYRDYTSTIGKAVESALMSAVENKRRALDMFLEERVAQLKTLAAACTMARLGDDNYLDEVFHVLQSASNSYIDLGVIGQEGNHEAYSGPYDIKGFNYRDEHWFHEVMLRGVYISDVFMGYRNFPHFIIAVTRRENGRSWILRATIDSEVFNRLVKSVQVGANGDAFLVNGKGILQTPSRLGGKVLTQAPVTADEHFTGARVEQMDIQGRNMAVGMAWLGACDWMLVIMQDPAEVMSSIPRARAMVLLFVLAGVAVIACGAYLTMGAVVGRLAKKDREKAALDASVLQSSKMAALGKLAAGVAHEVNNPLTLIREGAGWVKDLLEDTGKENVKDYDEVVHQLDMIELHVDRAREVTHRLLSFGRRMEPRQENLCLNTLTSQTLRFLEQEALHRDIAVIREFDPELPGIASDASQLQQVILNIVDNAFDAVGKNGQVRLSTGTLGNGREVYLRVEDSGPGIPPEQMEKLFDPFYTTKPVGDGTGLGLAICYSIMEKLGGRIEVVSNEGEGSVFTIILPK